MSADSDWGDFLTTDTPIGDTTPTEAVVALPEPSASIVESEISGAVGDQDWSNWHADSGDDWADSAQDWADYAVENAAAGNIDVAESAMARAADHADIAENNYTVSADYSDAVVDHVETAAAEVDWATSGTDTSTSYDTSTYDATSYDASTSYDTSYDAGGYDATGSSFDTSVSYDVAE
ncbi:MULTISPECIES: hypothetical protein [unclassified Micromonospora]|uniref:hypothetical protein n=1 Tax=unclassified Micromonospora TaxID=2617518 RepID=UPI001C5D4F32|nr:hypothetical protein [Micromonospora sp. RL09-050-HVF-A]MBW4700484.1 hypothetical protein [Micromonospora sp. RL09-050-HVF-A]